ncbi:response regulator transcription factor [Allocoleopsis sp.]|uniref:response regulator transcription factor n=1 Tax=Allocoleopsis sp. TaxID=3088169 RepID=UPI002FD43B95
MVVKILVIEDEPDIRENLEDILKAESFAVITAKDGYEGVAKAIAELPDLILCDRMMRPGDGTYVLRTIRGNNTTSQIPFIFLTAMAAHNDVREGMNEGADDYLSKPFSRFDLLAAIYAQLEKAKSRAADTKSKIAVISEALRTQLNHIYGNLELYRQDNPNVLQNEEFSDAWNATLLVTVKLEKLIAALVPKAPY